MLQPIDPSRIWATWQDGGLLMVPLALLALVIYFYALQLFHYLRTAEFHRVKESVWSAWIEDPEAGEGEIGEMIRYSQGGVATVAEIQGRFAEINAAHLPRLTRRIVFLSALVTTAPLMGLLGTVTGMLTTFEGLAARGGKVIDLVATGVHEALITTQTGLIIAIPGYIMVYSLHHQRQELAAFLGRLESVTVQRFNRGPAPGKGGGR